MEHKHHSMQVIQLQLTSPTLICDERRRTLTLNIYLFQLGVDASKVSMSVVMINE